MIELPDRYHKKLLEDYKQLRAKKLEQLGDADDKTSSELRPVIKFIKDELIAPMQPQETSKPTLRPYQV